MIPSSFFSPSHRLWSACKPTFSTAYFSEPFLRIKLLDGTHRLSDVMLEALHTLSHGYSHSLALAETCQATSTQRCYAEYRVGAPPIHFQGWLTLRPPAGDYDKLRQDEIQTLRKIQIQGGFSNSLAKINRHANYK